MTWENLEIGPLSRGFVPHRLLAFSGVFHSPADFSRTPPGSTNVQREHDPPAAFRIEWLLTSSGTTTAAHPSVIQSSEVIFDLARSTRFFRSSTASGLAASSP